MYKKILKEDGQQHLRLIKATEYIISMDSTSSTFVGHDDSFPRSRFDDQLARKCAYCSVLIAM